MSGSDNKRLKTAWGKLWKQEELFTMYDSELSCFLIKILALQKAMKCED